MIQKINDVTFHPNSWLCPSGYAAITLFGHVFMSKNLVYLQSKKGKILINHESIHVAQARSMPGKWIQFYIWYAFYYIKNLFRYNLKHSISYRQIPFEAEAYCYESDEEYLEEFPKTQWKKFRDNILKYSLNPPIF